MLIARPSCAPMVGVKRISSDAEDDPEQCDRANRAALRILLAHPGLHTVVLVIAARDVIGQSFAVDGQATASSSAALTGLDTTSQRFNRPADVSRWYSTIRACAIRGSVWTVDR